MGADFRSEHSDKFSGLMAKALQKIIKADPDYLYLVSDLQGGSLKLVLTEWDISLVFLPGEDELDILSVYDFEKAYCLTESADVSILGRLPDFLGLMRSESSSLIKSHVQIQGDVRVLARYQSFFQRWKVDFGHVLARLLGENAARALYPPAKKMAEFLKYQREERLQDLKEVIFEEKQLFVPKAELEEFYDDLKQLQMRVDRLTARWPKRLF
jgi:ubiquinone biosynthesis protein UbiJ